MRKYLKKAIVGFGMVISLTTNLYAKENDVQRAANLEYRFKQYIKSSKEGYNLSNANKIRGSIQAIVEVISEDSRNRATNFIVIDQNGRQKTNNTIIVGQNEGNMTFYNAMFEGTVILRANTGGTAPGYYVEGAWSPNR